MIIKLDTEEEIRAFYSKVISEVCGVPILEDNVRIAIVRSMRFRGSSGLNLEIIVDNDNECSGGIHSEAKFEEFTRKWAHMQDEGRNPRPQSLSNTLESFHYCCNQWGINEDSVSFETVFKLRGKRAPELGQKIIAAAFPKKLKRSLP